MDGLPGRQPAEEDAFLDAVRHDPVDELVEWTRLAIEARRPTLAGRLFNLVDDQIDPEPGTPLHKAAMAARMLLFQKETPDERSWSALDEAWIAVRRARVRRIKQRWRDRLQGQERRIGRLERKRR